MESKRVRRTEMSFACACCSFWDANVAMMCSSSRQPVGLLLVDACGRFGLLLRELLEVFLGLLLGKGLSFGRLLGIASWPWPRPSSAPSRPSALLYSASSRRAGPRPCPWRRLGYHLLWFPCCRVHRACVPRPIPPSSLVWRPSRTWPGEMQRWRQAAAKCSDARRRRAYVQFSCVERRATIESAVLDHYLLAMANQCGGLMTRHWFFIAH